MSGTHKRRTGAVAVLVAVCLVAIMGVIAIAIDGGMLLDDRRQAQATADAAALAAAADLFKNYATNAGVDVGGTAKASALAYAALNGYNNDGTTNTVTVNIPPTSGNYANKPGYAEVIIQYNQARGFSLIFGTGNVAVKARAVARGRYIPGTVGVLILDPSSTDTCEIDGILNIGASGRILVNSSDSAAVRLYANGSITAKEIDIVGSPGVQDNVGSAVHGTVKTGVTAASDPLAWVPEPTPTGTNYGTVTCSGTCTLQPGIYKAINVNANAQVTMNPGIYYLSPSSDGSVDYGGLSGSGGNAGITMGNGATLTGNGVMIYNQSDDNIDFINAGAISLTPPTTGVYQGISIFQPRSDTSELHIVSSSNMSITGTLYAAKGIYDLRPMGSAVFNMANYISWQFESGQAGSDFGNGGGTTGTVNLNPSQGANTDKSVVLVE
jgi:Flp pilus assembly protein TadG